MARERYTVPQSRRLDQISPHYTRGVEIAARSMERGFALAEELVEDGILKGVRRPSKKQGKNGISFYVDFPLAYNEPEGETIKIPVRVVTTFLGFNFVRNKYSDLGLEGTGIVVIVNNSFTDERLKELIGEQAAHYRHVVLKQRAANDPA